jgi:Kef-type K+ transport system membrane component KefB
MWPSPLCLFVAADPVAPILVAMLFIGFGAAIGGRVAKQFGQPPVLGELLFGVAAGNTGYFLGDPVLTVLREGTVIGTIIDAALTHQQTVAEAAQQVLGKAAGPRLLEVLGGPQAVAALSVYQFTDLLSRLGVIVLLFLVGLETTVHEMRRVGRVALQVAVIGMVAPFLLGLGVVKVLLPEVPLQGAIFVGAIFTATSVGITARVFRDLDRSRSAAATVVLGAAVIDDVLGLIVLAVVSGLVSTGTVGVLSTMTITLKAVGFLGAVIGLGLWLAPKTLALLARIRFENVRMLFALSFAFLLSWAASEIGLATIVGAFAAGLILEEMFFDKVPGQPVHEVLHPLESFMVPVFFVLMGLQVKLETFADPRLLLEAGAITVCAVLGKLAAGLGSPKRHGRLAIGLGMMPRGEVGLIFASIGKSLGVVDDALFSSVVIMVMVTTLLAPPLLKLSLGKPDAPAPNKS